MTLNIRKAEPGDFESILSLIKEFSVFQKTPEKVTITLTQMVQNAHLFNCYIAETDNNEIVGFASFFYAYYSWTGKALYIDDIYVKESFRGMNIGSRLLLTLIELAKTEHCVKLKWLVSKWNKDAIKFYQQMGADIDDTELICDLFVQ